MGMGGAVNGRVAAIAHGGEGLVGDVDRGRRILGEVAGVGDRHRDGLARIADLAARQRPLGAHRGDRRVRHRRRNRIGREAARHVVCRQHRVNARHRARRCRIDPGDARVRMGAPHETGVKDPRHLYIIDISGTAGQQSGILDPRYPRPELLCSHPCTPAPGRERATL